MRGANVSAAEAVRRRNPRRENCIALLLVTAGQRGWLSIIIRPSKQLKVLFLDTEVVVQLTEECMDWTDRIGRRVKLRDLHVLMTVAQSGTMTRAAELLAISKPVVSKTISDLEHALGVRLLDRTSAGVEPTAYGRAFLNCGIAVFDDLRRGVQEVEYLSDPTVGELWIGAPTPLTDGLIPAVLTRLTERFPGIVFHAVEGDTATLCRLLRERKID